MVADATRWATYAGGYAFVCSTALLLLLYPVSDTLGELLALPGSAAFVLAVPVPVLGALGWWAIVERRGEYTYPVGAVFGLVTALATVGFWVLVFAVVWGPSLVLAGGVLVAFVVAVAAPAALVVGVSLMYARRRPIDGPPNAEGRAPR